MRQNELCTLFEATLDSTKVNLAADEIQKLSQAPEFLDELILLLLNEDVKGVPKLAASVYTKNWIVSRWGLLPGAQGAVPESIKQNYRSTILSLVLSQTDERLASNLLSGLIIVADYDFPREWPDLLPACVNALHVGGDAKQVESITNLISNVLKRYRYASKVEDTMIELKYILENLCETVLSLFTHSSTLIPSCTDPNERKLWIKVLYNVTSIVYTLHLVDIPEFFEDRRDIFIMTMTQYLMDCRLEEDPADEDDNLNDLDTCTGLHLATMMMKTLTIYAHRYSAKLEPYVENVILATLNRIEKDLRKQSDEMVIAGLGLLSAITNATWSIGDVVAPSVKSICMGCVIPNFKLRASDMEEMQENPVDFIRADIDEVATDRRGAARQLVEELNRKYEAEVLQVLNGSIVQLMDLSKQQSGSESDINFDAAVNIVMAVAIKVSQRARGVITVSDKIDLETFQKDHIHSIIHDSDRRGPLALIAALKFLYIFRNQMTDCVIIEAIQKVTSFLTRTTDAKVVERTYSAICIEKLLNSRKMVQSDLIVTFGGDFRLKDNQTVKQSGLTVLSHILPVMISNHEFIYDNEHYAKLLETVVRFIGIDFINEQYYDTVSNIINIVRRITNRPVNSIYNHSIFESVAILVQIACEKGADQTAKMEELVLPDLVVIAKLDEHDFLPYAYQVLSVVIEARQATVPSSYGSELYGYVLEASKWNKGTAEVKGIMQLLKSYFSKYSIYSTDIENRMDDLTERLKSSFRHKKLVQESYQVVSSMFILLPLKVIYPIVKSLFIIIVNNLQDQRTHSNIDNATLLVASYSLRLALDENVNSSLSFPTIINEKQTGIFAILMDKLFNPALHRATQSTTSSTTSVCLLGFLALLAIGGLSNAESALIRHGICQTLSSLEHIEAKKTSIARTSDQGPVIGPSGEQMEESYDLSFSVNREVGDFAWEASFARLKNMPPNKEIKSTLLQLIRPKISELVMAVRASNKDQTFSAILDKMTESNPAWTALLTHII